MRAITKDPPSEEVKKQMLASGKWRLTQSGKLVRVDGQGGLSVQDVFGVSGEPLDYSPENNYGDGPVEMKPEYMLGAALGARAVMPLVDDAALAVSSALKPVGTALNTSIGGVTGVTANNLLGAAGASDFIVNRAKSIPEHIKEGNYADAAVETGIGALDLLGVGAGLKSTYGEFLKSRLLPNTAEGTQYLKAEFAEKAGGLLGDRILGFEKVLSPGLRDKVFGMDINPALVRRHYSLQDQASKAQAGLLQNPDFNKFLDGKYANYADKEAFLNSITLNSHYSKGQGDIISAIDSFLSKEKYAMNATTKKAILKYRNTVDKILKETMRSPLIKGYKQEDVYGGTRTANRLGVHVEDYSPQELAARTLSRRTIRGESQPYSLGDALSGGYGNVPQSPVGKVSVQNMRHQLGLPLKFQYDRPYYISPTTKAAVERGYTGRTTEEVAQEMQEISKKLFERDYTKAGITTDSFGPWKSKYNTDTNELIEYGQRNAPLKLNKSFANSEEMLKMDPIAVNAQGTAPFADIIEGGISKRAQVALSHHSEFKNMGAGHVGKGEDGFIDTPRGFDFMDLNKLIKKSEYPTTKKEVTVYRNQGSIYSSLTPVFVNRGGSKVAVEMVRDYQKGDLVNGLSQAGSHYHAEAHKAYKASQGAEPIYRPTSTSLSPGLEGMNLKGGEYRGQKLKIVLPEGTPAASTANIHGSPYYEAEMELMLHPEQKYVVESVDDAFINMRAVTDAEYNKLLKAQGGSKAQGGMITMKRKAAGMSPIRK